MRWLQRLEAPKGVDAVEHHAVTWINAEVETDSRAGVSDDLVVNREVALLREDRQAGAENQSVGRERDVAGAGSVDRDGRVVSGGNHDSRGVDCKDVRGQGGGDDILVSANRHDVTCKDGSRSGVNCDGGGPDRQGAVKQVACARACGGGVNLGRLTDAEAVHVQQLSVAEGH